MFNVKLIENDTVIIEDWFDGFLNNGIIKYDDGVNNIFDLNKLLLKRISDDYKVVFDFLNLTCCSSINGFSVNMIIEVIDKDICSNSLYFKYKIIDTGNIYEYSIMW